MDLEIEIPCHEPLAQQFHDAFCLDAASAVLSAPSRPERPTDIFRGPQRFVSRLGTGGDGIPCFALCAAGAT